MRLDKGVTREFIDDMITRFKNNKRLHKKYVPFYLWRKLISGLPDTVGYQEYPYAGTYDGRNRCPRNK